jgi:predicted enzyme related to lactoylglutathione lyase
LFSRHPETALEFYHKTLGYDVRPEPRTPLFQGDFILSHGVRARAGVMVLPMRTDGRPGWLGLVRVADLEETLAKVKKHGGRVLNGPSEDLIGGRVAVAADPHGAVLGLVQTTKPAPAAVATEGGGSGSTGDAKPAAYEWRDPGFYDAWFDPESIVLPPPTAFRGFGTDGKPMPLLPAEARPAGAR